VLAKPELRNVLKKATLQSFDNIVSLAVQEKVDAVLIAGDIYDSADKSLRAQLAFRNGLGKLSEKGIPSFVVHGNHDPLKAWSSSLNWPQLATVFPTDKVGSAPVYRDGKQLATIYGISYKERDVSENLALRFKQKPENGFAIGLLHTNAGGDPNHENYAPCRIEDLIIAKMDYWALGHIHSQKTLRDNAPAIVYCGNSQGRGFHETGPRGCCVVTLYSNLPPEIRFEETNVVRFQDITVNISQSSNLDDVVGEIVDECKTISTQINQLQFIIRVRLTGRTKLHKELKRDDALEVLLEEIQSHFEGLGLWVELKLETRNDYDIDSLCRGNDFLADMIHLYNEAELPQGIEEIRAVLQPVFDDWQGGRFLDELTEDDLRDLLIQARSLSLDNLTESN
tara:strand:+ start:2040 stop:3227 length:1188 start_codon:yes stop_codon:yes gene_type:complete